jgi:hypothetical protein
MNYSGQRDSVIPTSPENLRRAQVAREVDELYEIWQEDMEKIQGFKLTSRQKVNYFREAFIEAVWRKWPK